MSRVVAIDQGTTSTRAATLDPTGLRIVASREHTQHRPRPGWVEHDADELLDHVRECLDAAGPAEAVGIDNQGETVVAWDAATGRPLARAIVWQDARTRARLERLKAEGAEALTLERAGLPLDPYFSASKLAWYLDEVPEARELLRVGRLRLGTTDAFFLDRLCGAFVTDATTASRTSLMDLRRCAWDAELCALFGVPIEALPAIVPTTRAFGAARAAWGEAPITASAVDQQAALYGHGCRRPGEAKVTFGTGAFALMLSGHEPAAPSGDGLLPTVAWSFADEAPAYALDGGVYNAGSAVDWGRGVGLFGDYGEIDAFEGEAAIARGLAFVPALSGLACPHWDRRAAGAWIGLGLETSRADLIRAVLEGVALRTAELLDAMWAHHPAEAPVSIDGGLSRNRYFRRFLATVLRRPVLAREAADLTALGCGLMAARGAGLPEPDDASGRAERVEPAPAADVAAWRGRFAEAVARCRSWRDAEG